MSNPETIPQESQTWNVQPEQVGQRLDRYLVPLLGNLSRTTIQHLIDDASVFVNGRASKSGYVLRDGDKVQVLHTNPSMSQKSIIAQALPLDIIYEDEDLLIVNKAAGMVVHPAPGHTDDTLVNALVARYPDMQEDMELEEEDGRPGIVHRLDKDTSGLLIVAKNKQTQAALIEQMRQHEVVKRYLALVEGIVALDKGTIDAPIGRDMRHRQQMTITALEGREARTHFRVQQRLARHTLLLLQLETGRTHQIRVHLQAIGHPVVGDPVYGSGKILHGVELHRQFLHAYQLSFKHPSTGVMMEFEAPLPLDLQTVVTSEALL